MDMFVNKAVMGPHDLQTHDLKPGDILLFSYIKGDFESELIHKLTRSPVSHAALVAADPSQLIEQTPPKIRQQPIAERIKGRTIEVMRLQPADSAQTNAVVAAAQRYLSQQVPYSMALDYALAVLFAADTLDLSAVEQTIMAELMLLAMHDVHDTPHGQPLMVCSTLVSQCFIDAKVDLALVPETLPLAFIDKMIALLSTELPDQDELPAPQVSLTSLLQQPSQHLKQHSAQMLAKASLKLARVLCQRLNLPVGEGVLDALRTLKQHQAMFISPNDLLVNARALAHVGQIITP
jgi:hypothetical protein